MSDQTTSINKKTIRLTMRQVFGLCVLFFISLAALFTLGVYVGRGNPPYRFDIESLQAELARLKEAMVRTQESLEKQAQDPDLEEGQFDFQEYLKEEDEAGNLLFEPKTDEETGDTELTRSEVPLPGLTRPEEATAAPQSATPAEKPVIVAEKPAPAEPAAPIPPPVEKPRVAEETPEPPPSMATPPAPAPPDHGIPGGWSVQVAAVTEKRDAARIRDLWAKNGVPAYVVTALKNGTPVWHRVRLGPFQTRAEAEKVLAAVKARKADAYIVRQNPIPAR